MKTLYIRRNILLVILLTAFFFALSITAVCAIEGDSINGEQVLKIYLESIKKGDYERAYSYLNSKSMKEIPFSLYARMQDLSKSIREAESTKIILKETHQQISVFTVEFSFKEKLAYSLPYIPSSDFNLIQENGAWKIVLDQRQGEIEEQLQNYNIDHYEDQGKDINTFAASLDKEIADRMKKYGVQGCVAVLVENNKISFQKPYGFANVKERLPVTEDTFFNIGSVSKTVSAWGVLKLSETGAIDLDSPAEKYMKRWHFPKSSFDSGKITVRQLLEHRSGLTFPEKRGYGGYPVGSNIPDLIQSLRGDLYPQYAVSQKAASNENFEYSNANYTVLQLIIEDVTGISFEEYMQEEVFIPLEINNATFNVDKLPHGSLAKGYNNAGKSLPLYIHPEQAPGGLYCTAKDLASFVIAMNQTLYPTDQNLSFLSENTVKPVLNVETIDYKLGTYVFNSRIAPYLIEHQGHSQGYMALYAAIPEAGSAIIFLTNSDNGKAIMQPLADKWLRWKSGPSKPIFSTLKYTLQESRNKAEAFYIVALAIPSAICIAAIIAIILGVIRKKRRLTSLYLLCYSKLNIAAVILSSAVIILWWSLIYDRIFDIISPFPEVSYMDLATAVLITSICLSILMNILFVKFNSNTT